MHPLYGNFFPIFKTSNDFSVSTKVNSKNSSLVLRLNSNRFVYITNLFEHIDYYYYHYYYYYTFRVFYMSLKNWWFLLGSLSNNKSPQVSRIRLRILTVLNNAVIWIVSTRLPTSKSSRPFNNPFATVPKAPITIIIIIIIIIITPWEFFTSDLADGLSLEFEWQQVLNDIVAWMISTRPPTSKSCSPFNNPLVTVPKVLTTIGIIVTFMFHNFIITITVKMLI